MRRRVSFFRIGPRRKCPRIFLGLLLVLAPVLLTLVSITLVLADDCNRDWRRAED
jgi:hypothetical protein